MRVVGLTCSQVSGQHRWGLPEPAAVDYFSSEVEYKQDVWDSSPTRLQESGGKGGKEGRKSALASFFFAGKGEVPVFFFLSKEGLTKLGFESCRSIRHNWRKYVSEMESVFGIREVEGGRERVECGWVISLLRDCGRG